MHPSAASHGVVQASAWQLVSTLAAAVLDADCLCAGCFWGLELAYQRVPGVTHTSVGYTAGQDTQPDYRKVCSGRTGHAEAVQVCASSACHFAALSAQCTLYLQGIASRIL